MDCHENCYTFKGVGAHCSGIKGPIWVDGAIDVV